MKPIELKYSLCHPAGCTAETEATPEILDGMSKGGGMMVLAMNSAAQPVGFPVPLDGYNEAAAGPPVDNKKYAEARSTLMKQIRARQQQMAEQLEGERNEEPSPRCAWRASRLHGFDGQEAPLPPQKSNQTSPYALDLPPRFTPGRYYFEP